MTSTAASFSDIQNHWSRLFVESLAKGRVITGFPNGTFRPDSSVTRAEFATIITKAFTKVKKKREYVPFIDVPTNHWAAKAIQTAYETGFINGFPDNCFFPNNRISRVEVLVALVTGLDIASKVKSDQLPPLSQIYQDTAQIPNYATTQVAIATSAGLVASYPNIKLLNPNLAATRADLAVFIYQALLYLGEVQKIPSDYLVVAPQPRSVKVNHRREFRGVWVACVWNSNWPSKAGLPVTQQQAELIGILDKLQALRFNALILQVRPEGDALYASQLEPWSAWLTGTQGKAPSPLYDPLEFAIAECHKRNIELHAWFNPYRARASKEGKNVHPHIAVTNPEVVYQWGNQLWMDPGAKVVQDRTFYVIMDVVRRYDVDGIHLDDYFYPYPIEGKSFPDNKTYAAYQAGGGRLSLGDWRRENVNQMVQRLATGIKAIKSHVKFGISPFGIYRPGQPEGIVGLDAYNTIYADSKKWLDQGWVDYIAPQLYWCTDQIKQSYPALLKWWTEINPKQRHIYAGNNIEKLDIEKLNGEAWKNEEIDEQVKISRSLVENLSLGNIFFSMSSISKNCQGIADSFKTSFYPKPALVPTMSWQNTAPPAAPTGLQVNNRKLSWNKGDNREVRSWTLYKQSGETWNLQRVLSAGTTFATVEPGTYAVCAVDRLANESAGVAIAVS
ncbi:MAG: family 10 glycosylhydrolase [Scytonema sp. RU_4_4]|nr:family 10 glycosylhydrolase [Scytonema sp. RU_4_4]